MVRLTERRAFVATSVLFVLAVFVVLLRPAFTSPDGLHEVTRTMGDFYWNVYYPARAVLDGGNPYDESWYLATYPVERPFPPYRPGSLLIHLPFALLGDHSAALAYGVYSLVLVVLLAYLALLCNDAERPSWRVAVVAILIVLSRPGRQHLILGQPALEFILGSYVALTYARRAPTVGGAGLALSLLKPTFGVPLLVLMLACNDWRAVVRGLGLSAAVSAPVIILLATRVTSLSVLGQQLLHAVRTSQANPADLVVNAATSSLRVDLSSLLSRWVGSTVATTTQVAIAAVVLAVAAVIVRRLAATDTDAATRLAMSVTFIAILLSMYHQAYDLLLLTMPVASVVFRKLPPMFAASKMRIVLLSLYAFLAFNYVASYSVLIKLGLVGASGENDVATGGLWLVLVSLNGLVLSVIFMVYVSAAVRSLRSRFSGTSLAFTGVHP